MKIGCKPWHDIIVAICIAAGLMGGSVSRAYAETPSVIPPQAKA